MLFGVSTLTIPLQYYTANHVEREKALEGYGYKFIRLNRFNIGKKPVEVLNSLIEKTLKKKSNPSTSISEQNIQKTLAGLHGGELKTCPKCKEVRPITDFMDPKLKSGKGRYCRVCVPGRGSHKKKKKTAFIGKMYQTPKEKPTCPKCGSIMRFIRGPYGPFYGCPKYPTCRGTRKI